MNTASHVMTPAGAQESATGAWTAFWADPEQSRCAAGAPEIWQAIRSHWTSFSQGLAPGTSILDLGCGAGVVGRLLVAGRSDLEVTGVDSAKIPPAAHPHLAVLSQTAMEALPFPERRFGAAVSQFGYEYSQTAATAREISRVLNAGAKLSLLVHHAESAIVASTRSRLDAIGALLAPAMRATFCSGDATGFRAQLSSLLGRHPHDPLIAQLAQALPPRLGSPQTKRTAIWAAIDEALAPERCVAESLLARCVAPSHLAEWLGPLASVCELQPVSVLREPNGDPIAWSVEGVRSH
jgi:SAM-dependent methyltransferase